jgi:sugar phosphate isomerase/epimerase
MIPARRLKKGIWVGCFRSDLRLDDRFRLAAGAGFDGIELQADDALLGDGARLRALAELARGTVRSAR